jgi:hypothetical protein
MVVVVVGVDDPADRLTELTQIGLQLDASAMGPAAVDDEQAAVATDGPDRLVEQRVAPDPDAIANLLPKAHLNRS